MELDQMWELALGEIQAHLSRANFATWIKGSRLVDKKDGTFYVAVHSNFAKDWVEEKYYKNLLGILRNMDGSVKKIEFVMGGAEPAVKKMVPMDNNSATSVDQIDLDYQTDPETGLN